MGPTWIVVVVLKPSTVTVEEFPDEVKAHARYMQALKENYQHVYLASVRGEAH